MFDQKLIHHLNDVISPRITVNIVEWLEMVEVDITGHKTSIVQQQTFYMLVDREIARLKGYRIGIARRIDMHLCQLAH